MLFHPQDIKAFLAVVCDGNIGKAARQIGTSQPSVSRALQRLEADIGLPLFERGAHGARLTAAGQLFLESARTFEKHHTTMVRNATEMKARSAGLLRIGITNSSSDGAAVKALSAMVKARPGMRVSLVIAKSDALHDAVVEGDLDLVVVPSYTGHSPLCEQVAVGRDVMHVVARAGHPVFASSEAGIAAVADMGWVMPDEKSDARKVLTSLLEAARLPPPKVIVEVGYVSDAVMGLVTMTDLIALIPAAVLRSWLGRVQSLDIANLKIERSLLLLSRRGADWSPLMRAFKEVLQNLPSTDLS